MDKCPSIVFRYESINIRSLLNLRAHSIYFGSPRNFNDPYDCAITATAVKPTGDELEKIRQYYLKMQPPIQTKKQIETMSPEELGVKIVGAANNAFITAREYFLDTKGVACYSEKNDNLLMWAHYGGQSTGMCLAFDTELAPFSDLRKVRYVDSIPPLDVVSLTINQDPGSTVRDLYCTKSKWWEYEQEWRALHMNAGTVYTYEPKALIAIYFGHDVEKHALEIVSLIAQNLNPEVELHLGRRCETEFKVDFSKIEGSLSEE